MATISEIFGHKPVFKLPPLPNEFIIPDEPKMVAKRHVGIEVEVEKVYKETSPTSFWNTKPDNSLRDGGIEYVSKPVDGQYIPAALLELSKVLPRKADFSLRTSIHVHLNVCDWDSSQVLQYILVYLAVEPLLYKFVGRSRDKNNFCVPLYLTDLPKGLNRFAELLAVKRYERYSGLNLDALRKFGTLEFRHMHGTHDLTGKVVNWINLILSIVNYVEKNKLENTLQRICDLNTNSHYVIFVGEVFGNLSHLLDTSEVKSDLEKGVMVVKYSQLANQMGKNLFVHPDSDFSSWVKNHRPQASRSISKKDTQVAFDPNVWDTVSVDEVINSPLTPPPQPNIRPARAREFIAVNPFRRPR